MAIRKNMRHKGASARPARHHTDKHAARYIRKAVQQPQTANHGRGPLSPQRKRGGGLGGEGIELHRGGSNMAALDCIFITHAHMLSQTEIEEKH